MKKTIMIAALAALFCVLRLAAQDGGQDFGNSMPPPPPDGGPPPEMTPDYDGAPMTPPDMRNSNTPSAPSADSSGIESATPEQWQTLRDCLKKNYPVEFAALEKIQASAPRSAMAGYRKLAVLAKLPFTSPRGLYAAASGGRNTAGQRDAVSRFKALDAAIAAGFPDEYAKMTELRKTDRAAAAAMFTRLAAKAAQPLPPRTAEPGAEAQP
ncbi:MAG: hypothetical protein PHI85_06485 [Victivallaceae bacterium]|nr:hypothetical protein [Victivallaceae bacterium]